MAKPEHDPSIFNEPHLRPTSSQSDASESKAARALDRERAAEADNNAALEQSVHDEPDIFGRGPERITRDWSCTHCGYNRRGLMTDAPCPECGQVDIYRPPPDDRSGYQKWLTDRMRKTSERRTWLVALLLPLLGGPFAVVGAFLDTTTSGLAGMTMLLPVVVFGPTVEEILKIGLAAVIVETRPYLFKRVEQLQVAAIGSAAVFAIIENLLYLLVYISNPSPLLVIWRWTICVALHVGCTWVATQGLVFVWQRTMTELRPPKITAGGRWLLIAIVIHGAYNFFAMFLDPFF